METEPWLPFNVQLQVAPAPTKAARFFINATTVAAGGAVHTAMRAKSARGAKKGFSNAEKFLNMTILREELK
ncbi:MAG: hypothetical protein QW838_07215 [Candidatus Nitrosotenuis sp.]